MNDKRYLMLNVLAAVVCTTLSGVVPSPDPSGFLPKQLTEPTTSVTPSREFQHTPATDSLSSSEVLDTTTTDSLSSSEFLDATTTVPTPPPEFLYTTTTPTPGCWDGGKFYKPGDYIKNDTCGFERCIEDNQIEIGEAECDPVPWCGDITVCCSVCIPRESDYFLQGSAYEDVQTEVSPPSEFLNTTTAANVSPTPVGCWNDDIFYRPGDYININTCYYSLCTKDEGMVIGNIFCDSEPQCNRESPPNECCPACQNTAATTNASQSSQTEPLGCWDNTSRRRYQFGDFISYESCFRIRCTKNGQLHEGTLCQTGDHCNLDWPPNDCCPACQGTAAGVSYRASNRPSVNTVPSSHKFDDDEARNRLKRHLEGLRRKRQTGRGSKIRFRIMKKREAKH